MGPLAGLRVVELAGIGPAPYCGMVLADLGADVVRIDRPDAEDRFDAAHAVLDRGRRSVAVDLKAPGGPEVVLRVVERSDVLVEGLRPGVTERLGVGPAACLARNPRLVYGRVTGWGQDGPWAQRAGHDIDFVALSGALGALGRPGGPPLPPLNLLGDFAGGGLLLAVGVLAAVVQARGTGRGQVVDAAVVDGVASLLGMVLAMRQAGQWNDQRGTNLLDGGAPYYDVYECSDGRYVAVGALEDRFYAELLAGLGLAGDPVCDHPRRTDPGRWPAIRDRFTAVLATRPRDDWVQAFARRDACVAPVLSMDEAPRHPHHAARDTWVDVAGVVQPAPAPRFGGTPTRAPRPAAAPGEHTDRVLAEVGFTTAEIADLRRSGTVC